MLDSVGPALRPRDGRTALLVHGLGSRGSDLDDLAEALDRGWRCLHPDLPGHGAAAGAPIETLSDHASAIGGVVTDNAPLAVVGFSLGAWIALELWRRAPDAVTRVVLVDPPTTVKPILHWARAGAPDEAAARRRLMALYHEEDRERVVELMREHPATGDLEGDALRRNADTLLAADRDTLLCTVRALQTWRMPGRPAGSRAPVFILRGRRSLVSPPIRATWLALRLGGEVGRFDAGHSAHLSDPRELGRALGAALEAPGRPLWRRAVRMSGEVARALVG